MFDEEALVNELAFKAVKSSGSGGQHVNKVASKVELMFNLDASMVLSKTEKFKIQERLQHKLSKDNILVLQCDENRSQHRNKELVVKRFLDLIKDALKEDKKRIATKVPKAAKRKRLKIKKIQSEKKTNRKKPDVT